jgi:DNA repair ATPase RecN
MFSDSRLQNLQKDLENLQKAQTAITEDIRTLRSTMDAKVKRIQIDYGNDIASLERKYDGNTRRMPDVSRQIEARQRELEREREKQAANTNSAPYGMRRTG